MYKNIHISTADKTVHNAVNHEQNKDKMCINLDFARHPLMGEFDL